nr:G-type lectin S-receptor-like serine/threonine-protein kinase At4g27290 [Ipomoea batatas]
MAGISSSLAKTASPSSTPSSSAMAYALPSSEPPGGTFGSWPSKSRLSNIIQDLQSNHEHKPETLICKLHQFQKKGRTQSQIWTFRVQIGHIYIGDLHEYNPSMGFHSNSLEATAAGGNGSGCLGSNVLCEMAMGAVSNGGKRRRGGHTHMGSVCYVFLAFLCFFCNLGLSADSLRPGESITPNRTLLSAGGNFALGFFRPGNSSSSFLGIWYNSINKTVIWVANRESPLPQDSEAVFTLGYDGNLQLLDGGRRNIIWSTNISGSGLAGQNSTAAQLQDTGDLIVKQGESILWESFDGDSDTLMPVMRLMVNKKTGKRNLMRCWSSSDDPRPGKFSGGIGLLR